MLALQFYTSTNNCVPVIETVEKRRKLIR